MENVKKMIDSLSSKIYKNFRKNSKNIEKLLLLLTSIIFILFLSKISLTQSCTIDERTYTDLGYLLIREGKIFLNQEHPPLAKIIIGLGQYLYENVVKIPHEWHYCMPIKLLPYRFPVFFISAILAIIVYYWTKSLAGYTPAIISLILYYFSPQIISNSSIATLDLPFTFFFLLSVYFLWRFGEKEIEYNKKKLLIATILMLTSLIILLIIIFTPDSLYNFKYYDKFEENWYNFNFNDSHWHSFNQFFQKYEWIEKVYIRFWINRTALKNTTLLFAADDCISEMYVNGVKIMENDCKDKYDAYGFYLDLKEYLNRENNLVALKVLNKEGLISFNIMKSDLRDNLEFLLILSGLGILVTFIIIDWRSTLIGISIGLATLTREGGILLLFITLFWFFYLCISKKSIKFISKFAVICISFITTINMGYGFITSGVYFLYSLPLPVPYLFYNAIINSIEHSKVGHTAYLLGETSDRGFPHYYFVAFFLKTPLPLLTILILSLVFSQLRFKDYLILLLPIFFVFFSYSLIDIHIGIRLILPIYPFIFIISASSFAKIKNRRFLSMLYLFLIFWYIIESLINYPFYLSYCNQLAKGECYLYLSDSNIDWGQNIYLLGELSKKEKIYCGPIFGTITPNLQCEFINCNNISTIKGLEGYLAISQFKLFVERQCDWLKYFTPNKTIGDAILLYDLKILSDALLSNL